MIKNIQCTNAESVSVQLDLIIIPCIVILLETLVV
jgi:hypothetical protein